MVLKGSLFEDFSVATFHLNSSLLFRTYFTVTFNWNICADMMYLIDTNLNATSISCKYYSLKTH